MKYLFITLIVQDGEYHHDHRILHTSKGTDIDFIAQLYASRYYGDNAERNEIDWWEFNAGSIAVQMYSVVELSEFEYNLMSNIFDGNVRSL
jgi:hypothetical protein